MRTALTALLLLAAAPALAEPAITMFDVPGAASTSVTSVSQSGIVAGNYGTGVVGPCSEICGFVRTPDGTITTFSISDSDSTGVTGVNDSGTVTGTYFKNGRSTGFVRTADGAVTNIRRGLKQVGVAGINESGLVAGETGDPDSAKGFVRMPDGTMTQFKGHRCTIEAFGINAAGAVAGECDGGNNSSGFLRQPDGTMSLFRPPNSLDTIAAALDDDGSVAGFYFMRHDPGANGYVRDPDGTLHTFPFPDDFGSFGVLGMATVNGDRRVVGEAVTFPGGLWHGWIRHDDGTIEFFDAGQVTTTNTGTFVAGIVASGVIAGTFVDDNRVAHGYIRTP